MINYLENLIGTIRNYYYYSENNNEITAQIRVYQSANDWIGTKQTLVCNKLWLKQLINNLSELKQMLETIDQDQFYLIGLSDLLIDPDDLAQNQNLGLTEQLSRIDNAVNVYSNLFSFKLTNKMTEDLNYLFSPDLYESEINTNKNAERTGFLSDLVNHIRHFDLSYRQSHASVIHQIHQKLKLIYNEDNLNKIYQINIMFGFFSPLFKSKKISLFRIDGYLNSLIQIISN